VTRFPSESEVRRRLRNAQQQAEREFKRQNEKAVAALRREVDKQNREIDRKNKAAVAKYNREVNRDNDRAERHNRQVIQNLNKQLQAAHQEKRVTYSTEQVELTDRVRDAIALRGEREHDAFLSYAHVDGADTAHSLRQSLEDLGVEVWQDAVMMRPGRSQSRQLDRGLSLSRAGIALLTPAYLAGRFWTERELGVLLHKETLIPVLHGVTFEEVGCFSGILEDLSGFTTDEEPVEQIAIKIAGAVLPVEQ
jgi:hypothetical protein